MALQWERGFGDQGLRCEEFDGVKACSDRSCEVHVEELTAQVGTARYRLEKAQKVGWCRNTQMGCDRRCGFIEGMDVVRAENEAGSGQA